MLNRNILNPMLYQNNIQPIGPGIYHNPMAGLISLSSDGETWTTIADKNLGATQVYNDGDELTQANCGNYYQWGNNYGFPFSGDIEIDSTKVDATNYGPYYESDTFIDPQDEPYDWSYLENNNLWGGRDNIYSNEQSQGPCPEGFHIPSGQYYYGEMWRLDLIMSQTFGTNYVEEAQRYLKIPLAGIINPTGDKQGNIAGLWCKDASEGFAHAFGILAIGGIDNFAKADGMNIRPFSNSIQIPDDTRITLYGDKINSRIAHNPTLGLISLWNRNSDIWITISDKNLGATQVYNYGDELTEANCGKFYQRGNNYGFPFTGPTKTSTIKVNAANYGPYYKRGIFVTTNSSTVDWSSVHNNNLWGGETGTLTAMKGPCQEGYHIPTIQELSSMWSIVTGLGISNEGRNLRTYLKMPFMSSIFSASGTTPYVKDRGYYWSSTKGPWDGYSYRIWSNDDMISFQQFLDRAEGCPIRPFKNEPVTPNSNRIKLF